MLRAYVEQGRVAHLEVIVPADTRPWSQRNRIADLGGLAGSRSGSTTRMCGQPRLERFGVSRLPFLEDVDKGTFVLYLAP